MKTYQFNTNSNAAPFFSDSDSGFIDAESPLDALEKVVKKYDHPAGLYAATINECSEKNTMLARYLSAKAATSKLGGTGMHQWKNGRLFVNDKEIEMKKELWETF